LISAPKMTEIQSLEGSFNPVIVGVESQVSGFSQESEDEPTATPACPPKATDHPRIDLPGNHQLELPVSAVQHSVTNIIPVRKAQKARKSFFPTRPSAKIPDDCIVLD
jgi:hypothetical protein